MCLLGTTNFSTVTGNLGREGRKEEEKKKEKKEEGKGKGGEGNPVIVRGWFFF